jgi:hypothetical protein
LEGAGKALLHGDGELVEHRQPGKHGAKLIRRYDRCAVDAQPGWRPVVVGMNEQQVSGPEFGLERIEHRLEVSDGGRGMDLHLVRRVVTGPGADGAGNVGRADGTVVAKDIDVRRAEPADIDQGAPQELEIFDMAAVRDLAGPEYGVVLFAIGELRGAEHVLASVGNERKIGRGC